ncbi:MAG: ABC transporter ATP-binding protein [Oligoflexia bacterium]|nr:ABC transporter ATP-binding protein [Oligoflexia bacterium]
MKPVISVQNVSKTFRYWSDRPTSMKTLLVQALQGKMSLGGSESLSVLDDVSFDIHPGEFVGIMGRNGAGKSTMLKIICGIYSPTSGRIDVRAPIAPLIELGAGFHGDLSGYENIFLNAAILGFGRKATQEALPEILDFSELGERIHMPTKNYSSGMLVRLGFSIATHLAAPIILVDEVLAVGDAGFQKKCLKKIHALHKEGRTIVLVTHDSASVKKHCNRCIVIDNKKKVYDGAPNKGAATYLSKVNPGSKR